MRIRDLVILIRIKVKNFYPENVNRSLVIAPCLIGIVCSVSIYAGIGFVFRSPVPGLVLFLVLSYQQILDLPSFPSLIADIRDLDLLKE